MNWFNYIVVCITSIITIYFTLLTFCKINNKKIKYDFKLFLAILIGSILITINTYYTETNLKILVSFLILVCTACITSKEKTNRCLNIMIICYLIMMFYELVLAILTANFINLDDFNNSGISKGIFSIIDILLVYITSLVNKVNSFLNKIVNKLDGNKTIIVLFIIVFIVFMISDIKYILNFSGKVYIGNIILIMCIIVLIGITIYNYLKAEKELEKTEVLLNFMSKYEKLIDEYRINKHEMANNLLVLKSIKDKNSKEFDNILDDMISLYSNTGIGIKNIHKLPTGLKGIFYYKLFGLDDKGFNINIRITNQLSNAFKKLKHKNYVTLCKIIGILLDNSIEAASKSKNKLIGVDIYRENKYILIIIYNSFKNNIDLNKINNKYYSTKGSKRGLGLYIVSNLLKNNDKFEINQTIENDIFSTKITVK